MLMENRTRAPKLDDVAMVAGVSAATVSRYINDPRIVAPTTAERIRLAIEHTGYIPNRLAGGLASSRSGLVAALVPDLASSVFNSTIEAMVDELSADGEVVMLGLTGVSNQRQSPLIQAALARRPDAVILTGIVEDPELRARLAAQHTTTIETWDLPEDPIDIAIGFSHLAAGRAIARFAIDRGYRRAHIVSADGARALHRRNGFVEEWLSADYPRPTEQLIPHQTRFGHGRAVFRTLRTMEQWPEVVVCSSDWLAQGLLVEATAAGIAIPDDLAVIGFGNLSIASEMRPTITTVDIDGARIGREAVAIIRRRAAGVKIEARSIDVGFRMMARESA